MAGEIPLELTLQMGRYVLALPYLIRSRRLASICRPVSQVAGEIRGTLDRAKYMLSIAESSLADVGLQNTDKPGFRRFIRRTPLGVVLVIAPWKCVILFMPHRWRYNMIPPATHILLRSTRFCQRSLQATRCY